MKMRSQAAMMLGMGICLMTVSGCAATDTTCDAKPAAPTVSSESKPSSSQSEQIENGETREPTPAEAETVAASYQCGQIAILGTFELRIYKGFSNSGHGEAGQQAQQEMLDDLWASTLTTESPIRKHLLAIQSAVKAGDREGYDNAYSDASAACRMNGTGIEMTFLAGEGG